MSKRSDSKPFPCPWGPCVTQPSKCMARASPRPAAHLPRPRYCPAGGFPLVVRSPVWAWGILAGCHALHAASVSLARLRFPSPLLTLPRLREKRAHQGPGSLFLARLSGCSLRAAPRGAFMQRQSQGFRTHRLLGNLIPDGKAWPGRQSQSLGQSTCTRHPLTPHSYRGGH